MYSFYGGKPGNSFVIITTFRSVADMVASFKQGSNYTAVHYDQYVMINTDNKNDPDNGSIYRRGYNFTDENTGGAEYIGTIVGPAGKAPQIEMTSIDQVNSKHNETEAGFDNRYTSGSYNIENGSLVPGKMDNADVYNDTIDWACCSVRNENDEDTIAYVGFTFPYPVIDFDIGIVDPYINGTYTDVSSIARIDDKTHPFYSKWKINIPKGIKGDSLNNFRVITPQSEDDVAEYPNRADDILNHRQILVYDYYGADGGSQNEPITMYLGDYNMIEGISTNDNGDIIVNYTHNDDEILPSELKTIKQISFDDKTGAFKIYYNGTNGGSYETSLTMVKDIEIGDNGSITIKYTDQLPSVSEAGKVKWIKNISLTNGTFNIVWNDNTTSNLNSQPILWITGVQLNNNGIFRILWNNNTYTDLSSTPIKWINNINVDDYGTLTITYNNTTESFNNKIKWINSTSLDAYGNLTIGYNTGNSDTLTQKIEWIQDVTLDEDGSLNVIWNNRERGNTVLSKIVKWPTSFSVDTGATEGTGTQQLKVEWNNSNNAEYIGNPINYVMEMAIDNNRRVLVRYSDPTRRNAAGTIVYNGKSGWTNIGTLNLSDLTYSANQSIDCNWAGTGMVNNGTSKQVLNFTVPINKIIPDSVSSVTMSGTVRAQILHLDGSSVTPWSGGQPKNLESSGVTIQKTPTGINVSIETDITNSSSYPQSAAAVQVVNGTIIFH